ncbi:MAG: hypothetical protein J4215_05965 [Candidatus Diapherotrites archaeon]|uniref:50S ribosomal protein L34e n=1 Tax=Candidatus Iainarchaeum sp. TaxID=3101447 RepID=A0A8T4L871_9ARCH|nr:hypothetical protein [Candidatus Diapherotrites archaeon]
MTSHGRKGKRAKTRKGIAGHKTKMVSAKHGKRFCAINGELLHGVPHGHTLVEVRKLSKTKRRPSRIFGGILSGKATKRIIEDAAAVRFGTKRIEDVELRYKKFVEQALRTME